MLDKLVSKQSGSLQDQILSEHDNVSESQSIIQVSCLSIGPVQKGGLFACTNSCILAVDIFLRDCIEADALPHLKKCYAAIFDGLDETSVTAHFEKYASCKFNGDLLGSVKSRGDRSAFVLARWCNIGGAIDTSGSDLRTGVIDYFIKQNVRVNGQYLCCNLAAVRWFQAHPSRHCLGAPVEVWCKGLIETEGEASFIPIQRIHGKFIPAIDMVQREHVHVLSCDGYSAK